MKSRSRADYVISHAFQFKPILRSHPGFRCVNTIQKVRRSVSGFVQVQQGRRDNTILLRQKGWFSFLYFLTNIYLRTTKHSGSKNEAFSTLGLWEWRSHENNRR